MHFAVRSFLLKTHYRGQHLLNVAWRGFCGFALHPTIPVRSISSALRGKSGSAPELANRKACGFHDTGHFALEIKQTFPSGT
jgi:hypothetical protein